MKYLRFLIETLKGLLHSAYMLFYLQYWYFFKYTNNSISKCVLFSLCKKLYNFLIENGFAFSTYDIMQLNNKINKQQLLKYSPFIFWFWPWICHYSQTLTSLIGYEFFLQSFLFQTCPTSQPWGALIILHHSFP